MIVRLYDKDFNLLYQREGEVEDLCADLTIVVDPDPDEADWRTRQCGRIENIAIGWFKHANLKVENRHHPS